MNLSLALLGLVSLAVTQASQHSNFWTWFQTNQGNSRETSEFGDELSSRLTDIKSGLVYEIAVLDNAENELIISGDGLTELIPFVQSLVDSAPTIDGWKIIAFRPRMDDYANFTLNFGERDFDPKELWCWSRVEDGNFDLIIYHAGYSDDIRSLLVNATYILLDMALGEYDVMTGIRYIDHQELPDNPEAQGLYKFEDLRAVFDEYKSNINN